MNDAVIKFDLDGETPRIRDFPTISDNSAAYDHAIRMMELSVDTEIELSANEFDQYVMDNWHFNHELIRTAALYGKSLN